MKNKNMQRNKLDIILTDLQPVETPKIYTLKYFYDFLIKSKSMKKIMRYDNDVQKGIISPAWHAAPLKYHILKDNNELREMSYINPLSMIEVYCFLDEYERELLDGINTNLFSIRCHTKNNELYYKKSKNSIVEYEHIDINSKDESIVAKGNYYKIVPFRRLDQFYKSQEWFDLNRKYKFYGKVDYNKCFDSIYTHTYNWIVADNTIDAKEFNGKHILSAIDRLLQNMNMSMTNGIVVGPEFSRLLAEILLQNIDNEVYMELAKVGLIKDCDYSIKRYVDDIFIFAVKEETILIIMKSIVKIAERYRLRINDSKKEYGKLPHVWFKWKENVNNFVNNLSQFLFHDLNDSNYGYIVKGKSLTNNDRYSKIKELFQNMLVNNMDWNVKVVSYCLSTLLNKLAFRTDNNNVEKSIFNKGIDLEVYNIYDLAFFIYSFAATYNNTEKLISILFLIEKEIGEIQSKTILAKIAERYEFIFINGNEEDTVNLLLLYGCNNVRLSINTEYRYKENIAEKDNPVLFATYVMYNKNDAVKRNELIKVVESKIEEAIDETKNLSKLFLYKKIWWILVFYNCPFIDATIQDKMHKKIEDVQKNLGKDICDASKNEVLSFILNSSETKFIKWDLLKNEFYENVVFHTFERTLFNSRGQKHEIDLEY
ncbi:RNA-directed DNA polymerase [Clostridium omnivorum]|uniref:DNA-binding protein n=1 Tax=Clostridium omnivorum TaxID=1604902 RepID=A0ABQ5N462_9CLOT|nr:RNA-directed DNA polymerase [Clostridium sp. E14]GLC29989.1 DNA-binding protein [Clostridium sp. E14]